MGKGKLFGSAIRIKKIADILKLEITEKNSSSHKLQIIVDSWEFGEKLTTGISTFFDGSTKEKDRSHEETLEPIEIAKKSGTIILWDYDNVKLSKKGNVKDDPIGARISQELIPYQPIIMGICAYVNPLSIIERNKIDEIDKNIEGYQPKIRKDAADYVLLEKGKELISKHNPETLIIISGDHIFTSLLKFQKDTNIKIVVFHIGNISSEWLSMGVGITGINLIISDIHKCTHKDCNEEFEKEQSMLQHFIAKHSANCEKKINCKDGNCNDNFARTVDMDRHYRAKHVKS